MFLLWHRHPGDEEGKLLGVYSARERAATRIPDHFIVDEYQVDKDYWTEGFATMSADGESVDDLDDRR